jgi:hypothetical protein
MEYAITRFYRNLRSFLEVDMKKNGFIIPFLMVLFLVDRWGSVVQAQEINPCKPDDGNVTYYRSDEFGKMKKSDDAYGFKIKAEKYSPNFPIVIGQDMKEKTGVSLSVEVISDTGKITYESFDGYRDECIGHNTWQKGMEGCEPYYMSGMYYQWTTVPICTLHKDEIVHRTIDARTLKVWLVPTEKTVKWLGWDTEESQTGPYPLRYMFPEQWAVGVWTPEGYTTVGGDLYTEQQIEQFFAEHPELNFLKADPRYEDLPTYALRRVTSPVQDPEHKSRVLALFGEFHGLPQYDVGPISQQGQCLVNDRPQMRGECHVSTNLSADSFYGDFREADLTAKGITYLSLALTNVPMDLPGEWYIGVSVYVFPATYDLGRRTESIEPDSKYLNQNPINGYELDDSIFTVYVLISTPCDGSDAKACNE